MTHDTVRRPLLIHIFAISIPAVAAYALSRPLDTPLPGASSPRAAVAGETSITFIGPLPVSVFHQVDIPRFEADVAIAARDCCIRDDVVQIYVDGDLLASVDSRGGANGTHAGETHVTTLVAGPHTIEYRLVVSGSSKGLALLGHDDPKHDPSSYTRVIEKPKILILGSGVSAYLLAASLVHVYGVPPERITVTGRQVRKLLQFRNLAEIRERVWAFGIDSEIERFREEVMSKGRPEHAGKAYDIVFECTGGRATQSNLRLALDVLRPDGVLAMFGLTDEKIEIDFSRVIKKRIFMKGSFRASLQAYRDSLGFIARHPAIRDSLEEIIDGDTEIRGQRRFHDIEGPEHLAEVFRAAAESRERLGRILIRNLKY